MKSPPMHIKLAYGQDQVVFTVPSAADLLILKKPEKTWTKALFAHDLRALLPLSVPDGPLTLVVADKTRQCDYPEILPLVIEALLARGAHKEQIRFFIAYGVHARQSEEECLAAYGPVYKQFPFIHHSCTEADFADLGHTSRGTPARIRKDLLASRLILTIGAVSHHYFAGFGGGRKLLFPGLAEQSAIYQNHALFLDAQRNGLTSACRPGQLATNPVAEDLAEIHTFLPPYLSIHGLPNSDGTVASFRFGRNYDDFLSACMEYDRYFRSARYKQYDLVLASAGGFPKDINIIQAHKAIHNSATFVRDHGTLIILAECADQIGSDTFLPYFQLGGRKQTFAALARAYSGNGGTALAMMEKTERINICLVSSLPAKICETLGMRATEHEAAQALINRASEEDMAIIPNASLLIR